MTTVTLGIKTTIAGAAGVSADLKKVSGGLAAIGPAALKAGAAMQSLGSSMTSAGRSMSLFITAPILAAAAAVTTMAVNAVEGENLFNVAMGDMADEARAFSVEMSAALGMNQFATRQMMGTINQMVTSMGLSEDAAFGMSKAVTLLTQDMASFFNLSTDDAFLKLQAGITGEMEPLKRLGIIVNEVTVKNTLLTRGLIEQGDTIDEVQKVMGRFLTILDQTGNAQGDLARTLMSPANQMRIMKARTEEMAISAGNILIPVLGSLTAAINSFLLPALEGSISGFAGMTASGKLAAMAAIGLTAALGPAILVLGSLIKNLGIIIALLASPFVLAIAAVVAGMGLVVAAAVGIWTAFETMYDIGSAVWKGLAAEIDASWADIVATTLTSVAQVINGLSRIAGFFDDDLAASIRETAVEMAALAATAQTENVAAAAAVTTAWAALDAAIETADSTTFFDAMTANAGEAADAVGNALSGMLSSTSISRHGIERTTSPIAEAWQGMLDFMSGGLATFGDENQITAEEIQALYQEIGASTEAAFISYQAAAAGGTEGIKELKKELEGLAGANERLADMTTGLERSWLSSAHRQYLDNLDRINEALAIALATGQDMTETWQLYNAAIAANTEEMVRNVEAAKTNIEVQEAALTSAEQAWADFTAEIQNTEFETGAVLSNIRSDFQGTLASMFKGQQSFGEGVVSIWKGIADSILNELARIATNQIFQMIFGGGSGGGGLGGMLGGGGGFGSILSMGAGILGSIYGGPAGGAAASSLFGSIFSGGRAPGSGGGLNGPGAAASSGLFGGMFSGGFSGGTSSVLGMGIHGMFATGGDSIVTRPSLIAVGETGPEQFSVRPLAGRAGGKGGGGVTFSGINIIDDMSMAQFERRIARSMSSMAARSI